MDETPPATVAEPSDDERAGAIRRAAILTAIVGAAHGVLFMVAYLLLSSVPGADASDEELRDFYGSSSSRRIILGALYAMTFAGIAYVWFVVALRLWIASSQRRVNELHSNIQLVSGILYTGLFFVSAAAISAPATAIEFSDADIEPEVARLLPQYGAALMLMFAMRMAAMFVFTTSSIGRSTGVLPRWFAYAGYVVALFLLLSAGFNRAFVMVFPTWLIALALILAWRVWRAPTENILMRTDPRFREGPNPMSADG